MLKCHKCLTICIRGSQICQLYASELQSKLLLACLSASAGLLFFKSLFWKGINVCDSPISVCCICINLSVYICVFVFDSSDGSGEGRSQLVCPHGTAAGSTTPTQSQSRRGTIYPVHIHTEISVNTLRRGCRRRQLLAQPKANIMVPRQQCGKNFFKTNLVAPQIFLLQKRASATSATEPKAT